jgi:modulator of FtsH protease HflK
MSDEHLHPESGPEKAHEAAEPKSSGAPDPARGAEDASAQALSDALRSGFNIVKVLMVGLVMTFIASGIFTVKPNQIAIKLRFGKPVGIGEQQLLKPGLHWAFPYPIDEVVYVPVGESHTITSTAGWFYQSPEELASGQKPQPQGTLRAGVDGYTLTGDFDIIHARATLSYRIANPIRYVFNFANATNLLEHILDNALYYASARFTADDALYRDKLRFQEVVLARVNQMVDKLRLGVTIEPREVQTKEPLDVAEAFNNVTKAQQEGERKILEAETYAREATNKAIGEASVVLRSGMTASNNLVATIAAQADEFDKLLPYYQREGELFKQRLLVQTIQRVLTNSQYKIYLPERGDRKPWELRLQLSKEPEIPKKETLKSE